MGMAALPFYAYSTMPSSCTDAVFVGTMSNTSNYYFWMPQYPVRSAPDMSRRERDRIHLAQARGVVWIDPAYKISAVLTRAVPVLRVSRESMSAKSWIRRGGSRPLRARGSRR